MIRHRLTLGSVLVVLTALASMGVADPAFGAAASRLEDAGWFWRVQQGPVALPPPPGVAPDQLLVERGADGATAIAAVDFALIDGASAPVLTLEVVGEPAGAPAVVACPVSGSWEGGDARPWAARPEFDCSRSVQGQRSADGGSFVFPVAPLQVGQDVDVVIVPADEPTGPVGGTAPFRVVFAAPRASSLRALAGAPEPPARPTTGPPAPAGVSPPAPTGLEPAGPSPSPGGLPTPVNPGVADDGGAPAPVADDRGREVAGPGAADAVPADVRTTTARALGLAALLGGVGLILWPRSGAGVTPGLNRGVGSLTRDRAGPAPTLR